MDAQEGEPPFPVTFPDHGGHAGQQEFSVYDFLQENDFSQSSFVRARDSHGISNRAGELLTQALRIFNSSDMDWARRFMLSQDASADAALLTSPVQMSHASTITLSAGICETKGLLNSSANGTLRVDYLFVPAFTINDHSVGLVVERRRTGPFSAGTFSLVPGESVGKYCMNIKTAETLVFTSLNSPVVDNTHQQLSSFMHAFSGQHTDFAERLKFRPLTRVIWSGAKRQYINSTAPPCQILEELAVLCDTALLKAGKYKESMIVSNVTCELSRQACSNCAERALGMISDRGCGPIPVVQCNCKLNVSPPNSPMDFSSHDDYMQVHGGLFSGISKIVANIPGTDSCFAFEKVMNGVIKTVVDKILVRTLQKAGLKCRFGNVNLLGIAIPGASDASFLIGNDQAEEDGMSFNIDANSNFALQHNSAHVGAFQAQASHFVEPEDGHVDCVLAQESGDCVAAARNCEPNGDATSFYQDVTQSVDGLQVEPAIENRELIAKLEMRRRKNREAAARSNARRKERNDNLQKALQDVRERAAALRAREQSLRKENLQLRRLWEARTCRSALPV